MNDTRKFYYINTEGESHNGPVEAFLLPYMDVFPDSYVWTQGMKNWDFAGNILDRRLLSVKFDYCPCCNGEFEHEDINPDDRETIYKCKSCGFEFSYGATRMCSDVQGKFSMQYYKWNKYWDKVLHPNTQLKYKKPFSSLYDEEIIIVINEVNEIRSGYILYNATRCFKDRRPDEKCVVAEEFDVKTDIRGTNGIRINDEGFHNWNNQGFMDYVLKQEMKGNIPESIVLRQICEFFGDEYGINKNFMLSNGTRYYITSDFNVDRQPTVYGPPTKDYRQEDVHEAPSTMDRGRSMICGLIILIIVSIALLLVYILTSVY